MTDFITTNGALLATMLLVLVTIWYAWATDKMRKMMNKDYDLKTKPLVEFVPSVISSNEWSNFSISQTVINTGISFVIIDNLHFKWKLKMEKEFKYVVSPNHKLPYYISPASSVVFSFSISESQLNNIQHIKTQLPSDIIEGVIEYEYQGLNKEVINHSEKPHVETNIT